MTRNIDLKFRETTDPWQEQHREGFRNH